jgi:hypothetical protein
VATGILNVATGILNVATGILNVATGSFSRSCFIVTKWIKFMFYSIFLYTVMTAKTLLPQKWRMWRQGTFWLDNAGLDSYS